MDAFSTIVVDSHNADLGDIHEGVSLLFDDSFITLGDTSSHSLEIDILDSSSSLCLSHDVIDSLSLERPIQSLEMHIWRPSSFFHLDMDWFMASSSYFIWIPLPSSYLEWEPHLHLYLVYLLLKGRNFVCSHWNILFLQALTIFVGGSSLWGDIMSPTILLMGG